MPKLLTPLSRTSPPFFFLARISSPPNPIPASLSQQIPIPVPPFGESPTFTTPPLPHTPPFSPSPPPPPSLCFLKQFFPLPFLDVRTLSNRPKLQHTPHPLSPLLSLIGVLNNVRPSLPFRQAASLLFFPSLSVFTLPRSRYDKCDGNRARCILFFPLSFSSLLFTHTHTHTHTQHPALFYSYSTTESSLLQSRLFKACPLQPDRVHERLWCPIPLHHHHHSHPRNFFCTIWPPRV